MNDRSTQLPYSLPTLVGLGCILLMMAVPVISACDSGGSNGGDDSSQTLVPVEQGNRWEASISGSTSGSATVEATSETELDVTATFGGSTLSATLKASETSGGGLLLESLTGSGETETDVMLFKYPVEDGDTYQHTDGDGTTFDLSVSKVSVTVDAGEYDNCLEYTIRNADSGNLESKVVIKPGVGVVKWSGDDTAYELTSTNVDS